MNIEHEDLKARFDADGFVHIKQILQNTELMALRDAVDRQMDHLVENATSYDFQALSDYAFSGDDSELLREEEWLDVDLYRHVIRSDADARSLDPVAPGPKKGRFGFNAGGWFKDARIARVALTSDVSWFASLLLGDIPLRLWEDTTFVKEPGATVRSAFHQDKHFSRFDGDQDIIAWVALDDAAEESGALEYVRGSHKWGETFAPNMFFSQTTLPGSPSRKLPDIEARRDEFDIVTVPVKAGDVLFHHGLTVHGGYGNRSGHTRRAMSFRYFGPECVYQNREGSLMQSWVTHSLQDGDPMNCTDYPVARSRALDPLNVAA